ncbi:MAG: multidrug effflux MFS transporter [Rhodocyclaceae bacterium]|nr:multidrug effflux MFS transporter [Rhodocyclaceae bacterium]MBP7081309.1 multidrug effflux MFS transporter [Rhodocyclaceae bacterium]
MHTETTPPPRQLVLILAALTMIGPFAIDTYLPAFPAMVRGLHTTEVLVQQTLAAYLIPFAFMMLWHGAISDALGRKRVILFGLVVFLLASILCAFATSIETLLLGRVIQGLSAGTGVIVSRAMVRDLYDGADAQKLMAHVSILFAIAPAIAPIIGGWILQYFDWHGIFFFLSGFTLLLFIACALWLPETLPPEKRQSLHPVSLWHAYRSVFSHHEFRRLSIAIALIFSAGFIYILAAPVFLIRHLGVSAQSFGVMFVPVVAGMMIGSYVSGRTAGKISRMATIKIGFGLMGFAATLNLIINLSLPPGLPWSLIPLPLYTCGMALSVPTLQLMGLDQFPARRGLASSCMGTAHTALMAITSATIVPLLWGTTLTLALGMASYLVLGGVVFLLSRRTAVE